MNETWQNIVEYLTLQKLYEFYSGTTLFSIQETEITMSHLVIAICPIVLSFVIGKILQIVIRRKVFPRMRMTKSLKLKFLKLIHYSSILIGFYIGLSVINVPLGAFLGLFAVLGVGIGFGLQNLASNFISGVILIMERPVRVNDRITIDDLVGDVERIDLRTTLIKTMDNISVIVPNSKLLENNLINWSYGDPKIRIHVPVGVAYGTDTALVEKILLEIAHEHSTVMDEPEPDVLFLEFGDSSLNFDLVCWLPSPNDLAIVKSDLNFTINDKFNEHEVEIPFPQQDIHIIKPETVDPENV
ncbi:MAG: mechanosensitive ion channel [Lentisphaeria bacterium]|nr:mechanosensitive ion channel [Lentisphaeria bacterium]NQZ69725.1 mechanosensitive ion channel [Lentisphaeria bacterium]